MAYNASQLESWGHYRDGGGSYYENIASTVKPSQSSHSRIQGYVEPSRTRNGDGYQREAYHPENVAQHQRELDAWSRGGGGGGPSTAAPRSGKEWYGDASYNAPALPMAGHTTHADEYNPYGSRTVALKADFQNRRPRSRSVSPQSKRQRQDSTAQYGYGGRGGQEKAEYGSGWNEAGGYGGAAGGYERQMQRTAPHGGSMRDSSNQRSSSQYYQATPAAAATQASPTRFRGSNAQLGVQASPYSYNTGAAASTSYYPTTTYFTQRSPTNIRPARIGRPVIQQNIRRDLNAPSRSPVKPAPPPRREVKPPPPVKKSTTSSSTYKPAPKTSTTAGKRRSRRPDPHPSRRRRRSDCGDAPPNGARAKGRGGYFRWEDDSAE
ncbi:uncharacterized protein LOC129597210 [Paramacrobiotus metropolitanus]|uniref:uncharacterized protein LOC129597210 n=1 Tax=Paramacrobiotus metropolitanus TaxID=2943436 RepID=UPI00244600CC|nr:uncharacterized protein LOC129597210 [Paramacrobiotus metropolitanus]